jgi:hypothetical protein
MKAKYINIELQHFIGCPNAPILIERVKEVIIDFDHIDFKEVIIDSNEKADEVKFRGSPTLLINGEDFENQPEPDSPALACRYYINGLLMVEEIKEKIEKLKKSKNQEYKSIFFSLKISYSLSSKGSLNLLLT